VTGPGEGADKSLCIPCKFSRRLLCGVHKLPGVALVLAVHGRFAVDLARLRTDVMAAAL
jgi:hypothetical protein